MTPGDAESALGGLHNDEVCDPACNVRARASDRARQLARAQCTLGEIEAALVVDCGLEPAEAAEVLAELGTTLAHECHAGRAGLRAYAWQLAHDPKLARTITSTFVSLIEMLGRQHLGYTSQGVDEGVRKKVETLEREAARAGGKGPKLSVARSA